MSRAKATIWVVGDSTVSAFNDSYYIPREGYGSQIENYFSARVYNLARSGASSKDFTGMANYRALMEGSERVPALGNAEGEKFLVIGFSHNDEKPELARYTDPNGDYRTPGSFANSLYENYIKPALERDVIPVVCTPIARLSKENSTESYIGPEGHITADRQVGDRLFRGGDYRKAILDMVADLKAEGLYVEFADLTGATIEENVALGKKAQWLHSFTGAKRSEDGTLVPVGLDLTHTSLYGAKMSAWLLSVKAKETAPRLASYSLNMSKPTYEEFFAPSVNAHYEVTDYRAPSVKEMEAVLWPVFTDENGTLWRGTAFGDIEEHDVSREVCFCAALEDRLDAHGITLCAKGCKGRITSGSDGLLFYYVKLPAGKAFTLRARAKINSFAPDNRVSFGLMVRDDLYIDRYVSPPMGDYVSAGVLNQGTVVIFGRKSGALVGQTPEHSISLAPGTEVELGITASEDGFTLTYGKETASAGFDYPLTSVDPDSVFAGFYVAGDVSVTFSNIRIAKE